MDRNGLEVLERDECLRLLDSAVVGRVGITSAAMPAVLPVNYRRAGDRILFRTGRGTKLEAATHNAVVAFEVDDFDPVSHTGWSVMVTGIAQEVVEATALNDVTVRRLPRWAPGADGKVIGISMELVSGRRITPNVAPLKDTADP